MDPQRDDYADGDQARDASHPLLRVLRLLYVVVACGALVAMAVTAVLAELRR